MHSPPSASMHTKRSSFNFSPSAVLSDKEDLGSVTSIASLRKCRHSSGASFSPFAVPSWGNSNGEHKGNVRVVVRIRPMSEEEIEEKEKLALFPEINEDGNKECISPIKSPVTASPNADIERSYVADLTAQFESPSNVPLIPSVITTPTKFTHDMPCTAPRNENSILQIRSSSTYSRPSFIQPPSPANSHSSECTTKTNRTKLSSRPSFIQPPNQVFTNINDGIAEMYRTKPLIQSLLAGNLNPKKFKYDAVVEPSDTQQATYAAVVGDAVRLNIYRGYNTTIITYGQKNSGKTFSMYGPNIEPTKSNFSRIDKPMDDFNRSNSQNSLQGIEEASRKLRETIPEEDGIFPRAVQDLFFAKQRHSTGGEVTINLTFIEICNEGVNDLLSYKNKLNGSRDDEMKCSFTKGLTSVRLKSTAHAKVLMSNASRRRARLQKKDFKRSHTICTVYVIINPAVKSTVTSGKLASLTSTNTVTAKLTLVDLASTDRDESSGQMESQKGLININKDLLTLERCIMALADKVGKEKSNQLGRQFHVPFKDSKLTNVLRDSLGGNCCTVMIACASPCEKDLKDSLTTLKYAERTRSITNLIKKNIVRKNLSSSEEASLRHENMALKSQITELRNTLNHDEEWQVEKVSKEESDTTTKLIEVCDELGVLQSQLKSIKVEKQLLDKKLEGLTDVSVLRSELLAEKDLRKKHENDLVQLKQELTQQKSLYEKLREREELFGKEETWRVVLEKKVDSLENEIEEERGMKDILMNKIVLLEKQMQTLTNQKHSLMENVEELKCLFIDKEKRMKNNEDAFLKLKEEIKRKNSDEKENENIQIKRGILGKENSCVLQLRTANDCNRIPKPPLVQKSKSNITPDDRSVLSAISVTNILPEAAKDEVEDSMNQSFHSYASETDSLNSNQRAIRLHAQKLLFMADTLSSERNTTKNSDDSFSSRSSNDETESVQKDYSTFGELNDKNISSLCHSQNLNRVCSCSRSVFSGKSEHTEFFLPKLGLACNCGADKSVHKNGEPTALKNLLRPWQISFLETVQIHTIEDFLTAMTNRPKELVIGMKRWRREKNLKPARTKSSIIALRIWAKTCQTALKSFKEQKSRAISSPVKHSLLEINFSTDNDDSSIESVSTLGVHSVRDIDLSNDSESLLDGEFEV